MKNLHFIVIEWPQNITNCPQSDIECFNMLLFVHRVSLGVHIVLLSSISIFEIWIMRNDLCKVIIWMCSFSSSILFSASEPQPTIGIISDFCSAQGPWYYHFICVFLVWWWMCHGNNLSRKLTQYVDQETFVWATNV